MEFTTTKEFILQAHKSACTEWKLKIEKEFPEVFKPELEVGKWYYNQEYDIVFYLTEYKYDNVFSGYGFNKDKEWFSNNKYGNIFAEYCNREATHEEIESALIAEAKKRGYKLGVKTQYGVITNGWDEWEWDGVKLYHHNIRVFKKGEWVEVLPEEKTTISKEKALKIIAKKLKVSPENIIIE